MAQSPILLKADDSSALTAEEALNSSDYDIAAVFPASHQVIITTARGVYSWTSTFLKELFRSGSGGIVAATKASDDKDLIAVADRQVVILHDVKNGMHQSYRLKGADGRLRILNYQKLSDRLFFTTTLQNAVQSYSIREAQTLRPAQTHPSPPTVFAIAPSPGWLLSASSCPPTIFIQSLDLEEPPRLITPSLTTAAVAAATFHLERPGILALGFVDGSIAVFDSTHQSRPDRDRRCIIEIAGTKNVHTLVTETASLQDHTGSSIRGFDLANGITVVGNQGVSISSIAFVPGKECTVISVAADGRCCITDFVRNPVLISGWSVGGFATSLSIVRHIPAIPTTQPSHLREAKSELVSSHFPTYEVLVVIGRQDGYILLYKIDGKLLAKRAMEGNARIINVEWVSNSKIPTATVDSAVKTALSLPTQPPSDFLRTAFADAYALAESVEAKGTSSSVTPTEAGDSTRLADPRENLPQPSRLMQSLQLSKLPSSRLSPPKIPPRPTPRKDGLLAFHRAEVSRATASGTRVPNVKPKTITDNQPLHSGHRPLPSGDGSTTLEYFHRNPTPKESIRKASPKLSGMSGSKIGPNPLRKMSSIPARLGSKNKTSKSLEDSNQSPIGISEEMTADWTTSSARRQIPPAKLSAPIPKARRTLPLSTESESLVSDDTIIDWGPPERSQPQIEIREDTTSGFTVVTTSAHRPSTTAIRKTSTVVHAHAFGNGGLSSGLNAPITAKELQASKTKTARRSPRPTVEPTPHGASPSVEKSANSGSADVQVSLVERLANMERKIVIHSESQRVLLEKGIAEHLEMQKQWILKTMRDQDDRVMKYEQENSFLRNELHRMGKRRSG